MPAYVILTNHPTYKILASYSRGALYALKQAQQFIDLWLPGHTALAAIHPEATDLNPVTDYKVTRLPFSGFYESDYSRLVDNEEQSWCEYEANERQEEEAIPEELRLNESELFDIVFKHSNYTAAYEAIAIDYVDSFSSVMSDELGFRCDALGLIHESMDSPMEYNFSTDRLYAYIHPLVLDHLMARSGVDRHGALSKLIDDQFTSRSGFSSHYSNSLDEWLETPVVDWDHNELCALIEATTGWDRDAGYRIFERVADDSYQYWSDCVEWSKVETDIAEARAEKAEELRVDDPAYTPPPPRCDQTMDMFP